jgi:hypothetical protein
MTAQELAQRLDARPSGDGKWKARCPSHDDKNPSLSISEGKDGKVLLKCWAGCSTEGIVAKLGIKMSDLFSANGRAEAPAKAANGTATYDFVDLRKIKSQKADWIEEPYLARGELHAIQGWGGSYKGTMLLTWAAEFSQRREHVILLSAEDSLEKKIKPVLEAAGADFAFIHPLIVKRGETEGMFQIPENVDLLEQAIKSIGAKLVGIDPFVSYLSSKLNAHKDQDMKQALTPLVGVASRTGAAIVAVYHVKKDSSGSAKAWANGSAAFCNTPRVVMTMAKKSEDEVQLEVTKSNIGREGAGIILRAEMANVLPDITVPRLVRAGAATESVEEIANGERKDETSKTRRAAILILDILEEEGEQKQSELLERAAKETGLKLVYVKRKVYWDILREEELVDGRRDKSFQGGYIVSRAERERPSYLRTVTSKNDHIVTRPSHTMAEGHSMGVIPSVPDHDLNTTIGHSIHTVTPDTMCQESDRAHRSRKDEPFSAPGEPIPGWLNGEKAVEGVCDEDDDCLF